MPLAVTLTFDQRALKVGTVLRVTGPGGDVFDAGAPILAGRQVKQALTSGPAGAYTVQWRVTHEDGHVLSGVFGFTVGASGSGSAATSASRAGSVSPLGTVVGADEPARSGGLPVVVWLLVGAGVFVVLAGTVLAARRPPTVADDEEELATTGQQQP